MNNKICTIAVIIISFILGMGTASLCYSQTTFNTKTTVQEIINDYDRAELYWLTMNVYHEARGEEPFGMLLVALVTLDRQDDGRWGDTIKEVVTAPNQFSWYWDGKPDIPTNKKSWELSKKIALFAQMAYTSFGERFDLTYYHHKKVLPKWAKHFELALIIGNHKFYREK